MGQISVILFSTLDLVAQSPGAPGEDPEGFAWGGWQAPLIDEVAGEQILAAYAGVDALLLGRRTYDIFAAYWPRQSPDGFIAELFNRVPKYVASRSARELHWHGSTLIGAGAGSDLATDVRELRERHEHVKVVGSVDLVQSLLREKLADTLELIVYPILLGTGKKVFDGGVVPAELRLLAPAATAPAGSVFLKYGFTDELPKVGTVG